MADGQNVFKSRIEDFEQVWYKIPETDYYFLLKYNSSYQSNVRLSHFNSHSQKRASQFKDIQSENFSTFKPFDPSVFNFLKSDQ